MAKKTKALDRSALLACKPDVVEVDIKGHGVVFVKEFDASEFYEFKNLATSEDLDKDKSNLINLIVMGVCDEKGTATFADADTPELEKLPFKLLNALALGVIQANKLDVAEVEEAKKN